MSKNKKIILIITIIIVTIITGINVLIFIANKDTNTITKEKNEKESILEHEEKNNIEEEKVEQEGVDNSEIETENLATENTQTTNNKSLTDNIQQPADKPSTNNNQTAIDTNNNQITIDTNNNQTTLSTDNNQSLNEDAIKTELEETTKKWFIAQYNISKQQYINGLNNSIRDKKVK